MKSERHSLAAKTSVRRVWEQFVQFLLFTCAFISVVTTAAIVFVLVTESIVGLGDSVAFFQQVSLWNFLTDTKWAPQYGAGEFGILPLLVGTMWITGIAALIGIPFGLAT
ncbi:MAG TPA: phosphate ABC transporter permease subunit PstC, partial [Planctomycetaceae bacterium]|nr:phosphate ABC transporter permease subunit PstC [Planctomycetaceae bacterium]